jgi:flavin reductase (DIM6/NTAB) family NADH-FMN oxidoreductase RutF
MSASLLIAQLLNGLQYGVMLFLLAAGLTLVFGIMSFVNLAHGSLYMLGAYAAAVVGGYPILQRSRRFCINLLSDDQSELLKPFSTSALRDQRFQSDHWRDAWTSDSERLPWLYDASASVECAVDLVTDYGTHSLFIGRVQQVHCAPASTAGQTTVRPLVWLAGQQAPLALS